MGDQFAASTLARIDGGEAYLVSAGTTAGALLRGIVAPLVPIRGRLLDKWTGEFLEAAAAAAAATQRAEEEKRIPEQAAGGGADAGDGAELGAGAGVTVLHLACGLDARSLRVRWRGTAGSDIAYRQQAGPVLWVDLDLPEVVALRQQVVDEPLTDKDSGNEYRLVATSVMDDKWLEGIPRDRPVVVVMEGLTMYLSRDEIHILVRRIMQHFEAGGEFVFDAMGWLIESIITLAVVLIGDKDVSFRWSVRDPKVLAKEIPGLELRTALTLPDLEGFEKFPLLLRAFLVFLWWTPLYTAFGTYLRYTF
ncbi:S-adenosyl-L-methionine-dependent methyltransferase [Xylariales sp. PMI_506]|nr:S-adenosyl-L-methionine-dependent methyltransferase [Xylariales sp. PMI_506]